MSNVIKKDLTGKIVVLLHKHYYKDGCTENPQSRAFICREGFGCNSATIGQAIYGTFLIDGEDARVEGCQIERLATKQEAKKWFAEAKKKGLLERCVE